MHMKITVFGCGYVGLTTAVGLAEMGNRVLGVDTDPKKIALLKKGRVPFYEPGLAELLQRNIKEKRLIFSDDARRGVEESDIIYSAVGTPPRKDHHADLSSVLEVAKAFGKYGAKGKVFVNKSTVPVGTSEEIRVTIERAAKKRLEFDVISNPEFLREGSAVQDFFQPDRIIVGLEKESPRLKKLAKAIYRPMADAGVPIYFTDIRSSEVIKYASNAYLATRISLINELANFCEKAGADIKKVARGMGLDARIGTHYLEAGPGFGGSCLPKDLTALIETGKKRGFDFELLKAVRSVNRRQGESVISKLKKALGKLKGKNIAVWGIAFKPKTDDIREAPAIAIISALLKAGAKVHVYDPAALENARALYGNKINYYSNYYGALRQTDALIILTEWDEFRSPDYARMESLMNGKFILDGRNILDPAEVKKAGFEYAGVGRV
jgi:UDPglucose 6-dehydrogenase